MGDVPEVLLDPLWTGPRVPPFDLRPAGQPRPHREAAPLARGVEVLVTRQDRPRSRTDQTHVAADDVPELRQFIQAAGPEKSAQRNQADVVRFARRNRGPHRAELPNDEHLTVATPPFLPEEHRGSVGTADADGDHE